MKKRPAERHKRMPLVQPVKQRSKCFVNEGLTDIAYKQSTDPPSVVNELFLPEDKDKIDPEYTVKYPVKYDDAMKNSYSRTEQRTEQRNNNLTIGRCKIYRTGKKGNLHKLLPLQQPFFDKKPKGACNQPGNLCSGVLFVKEPKYITQRLPSSLPSIRCRRKSYKQSTDPPSVVNELFLPEDKDKIEPEYTVKYPVKYDDALKNSNSRTEQRTEQRNNNLTIGRCKIYRTGKKGNLHKLLPLQQPFFDKEPEGRCNEPESLCSEVLFVKEPKWPSKNWN